MMTTILFDCDGVLVDSERINFQAWLKALSEFGHNTEGFHDDSYLHFLGLSLDEIFQRFENHMQVTFTGGTRDRLLKKKNQVYYTLAAQVLEAIPGAKDILLEARQFQLKCIVLSNSLSEKLKFSLMQVGLLHLFDHIISGDHGKRKDYRFVLHSLGLNPEEVMVIDDCPINLRSAKEAGIKVRIGLSTYVPSALLYRGGASHVFHQLSDMNIQEFDIGDC